MEPGEKRALTNCMNSKKKRVSVRDHITGETIIFQNQIAEPIFRSKSSGRENS